MWRNPMCALLPMVAFSVILVAACSGGSGDQTLRGNFTLSDIDTGGGLSVVLDGEQCEGSRGYSDIRAGASVVVKDSSGAVIGTGRLGQGINFIEELTEGDPGGFFDEPVIAICQFQFVVEGLPTADFYVIEIGSRGEQTYSYEELQGRDWMVEFTIGP